MFLLKYSHGIKKKLHLLGQVRIFPIRTHAGDQGVGARTELAAVGRHRRLVPAHLPGGVRAAGAGRVRRLPLSARLLPHAVLRRHPGQDEPRGAHLRPEGKPEGALHQSRGAAGARGRHGRRRGGHPLHLAPAVAAQAGPRLPQQGRQITRESNEFIFDFLLTRNLQ